MRLDEDEDIFGQRSPRRHHRAMENGDGASEREIETCETMRNRSAPQASQVGYQNQNKNGTGTGMNVSERQLVERKGQQQRVTRHPESGKSESAKVLKIRHRRGRRTRSADDVKPFRR